MAGASALSQTSYEPSTIAGHMFGRHRSSAWTRRWTGAETSPNGPGLLQRAGVAHGGGRARGAIRASSEAASVWKITAPLRARAPSGRRHAYIGGYRCTLDGNLGCMGSPWRRRKSDQGRRGAAPCVVEAVASMTTRTDYGRPSSLLRRINGDASRLRRDRTIRVDDDFLHQHSQLPPSRPVRAPVRPCAPGEERHGHRRQNATKN
jgi:hypothetical protein